MNHIEQAVLTELKQGQRRYTFAVNVKRFYTNVDGSLVAKAAVPAALKLKFPVFMLGDFDRQGGYRIGLQAVPPFPGAFYLLSFVNGAGFGTYNVVGFSGFDA